VGVIEPDYSGKVAVTATTSEGSDTVIIRV
jgi:hypothetical protein